MNANSYNPSSVVNAIVKVGGKRVHFVELEIEQIYGDHHHFRLQLDHNTTGKTFMHDPIEQMDMIGRFVIIDLQHGNDNGTAYIFKGVITQVSMTGKDGKNGFIILEGSSPTIMLERGRRMDIYSDMNLRSIFSKLIDGVFSDYMKCLNEPTFENKIDFLMQYNETDWEFLKRIAYLFGENLFYSGSEILFGAYEEWQAVRLTYDKEVTDIEFCTRMIPNSSINYQYLSDQDAVIERQYSDKIDNSNSYLDQMEEHNRTITMYKPAKNLIGAPVYSGSEITEIQKRIKSRNAAQTVYIKGKSNTYESTIGRIINIQMPENFSQTKSMGTYRVIKSIHRIDQRLHYSNEFEAVPASLSTMPVTEPKMPIADSVLGKVTSHDDPSGLGRVQIDFAFANQYSRIWMRVLSPNAGSSNEVSHNRGFMFVPEVGDQVMIGFEYSDPNRPYVMGSLFHGKNSKGGQTDNHIKSIITRNGHTIEFDDAEESLGITIKDKNGNVIHLDTKGKNLEITSPETISMKSKNIVIDVEESIKTNVGKDIETNVGENVTLLAKGNIEQDSNKTTIISSRDNLKISTNQTLDLYGKSQFIGYSDGNTEFGAKNQMHMYGGSSLITAQNKIEQKAPNINEIPQAGEFIYDNEPQIVSATWMNEDMTEEISNFSKGDVLSLLVYTRNYKQGENISITVKKEDDNDIYEGIRELTLTGIVDNDGYARLKAKVDTKDIKS